VIRDPITLQAKLIVTGGRTESLRECKRLLRDAFPHARVRNAGFRCLFVIESENDPLTLAADLEHQAHGFIGHITSVLSKTETNANAISEAAVRIGTAHIGADESFASGFTSAALKDLSRIPAHWKKESVVRSGRRFSRNTEKSRWWISKIPMLVLLRKCWDHGQLSASQRKSGKKRGRRCLNAGFRK
jgi:hypothetical protein